MATPRVPQKRILGDATNTQRNIPSSPASAKKRKLETIASSPAARFKSSQNGPKGRQGSSQIKSQFESEVLEKMTQDLEGLKKNNAEKDQQWARAGLGSFDPETDNLIFQQIEAEEGTLHGGGKATVKLFGVTEASHVLDVNLLQLQLTSCSPEIRFCFMLPALCTTYISQHQLPSVPMIVTLSSYISRVRSDT